MFLGAGSYGEVTVRDGKAVKKFRKLTHLIQESVALKYLRDCTHIVSMKRVDFSELELHMELYDCSLRKWLEAKRGRIREGTIMKILRDILLGLTELHDRGLAHGDLKPGNILLRDEPLNVVLGDCGFVSIAKYAKVDRTAEIYRDPVVSCDISHDMFSFGICFLEMIGEIKIHHQASYEELRDATRAKIKKIKYRKILFDLLHEDRKRRPTARSLLFSLFGETPPEWITRTAHPILDRNHLISSQEREWCHKVMKDNVSKFRINRGKKGYGALILFLENNTVDPATHMAYVAVTLMILSSMFGSPGFTEREATKLCKREYTTSFMHSVLENLVSDEMFVNILLSP